MRSDIPKDQSKTAVQDDAKGQFADSQADRKASGVHSAKPTVITGSEDATVHKMPPGADSNGAGPKDRRS